jgi:hypothetical protein
MAKTDAKPDTETIDGWTLTYGMTADGEPNPNAVTWARAGYTGHTYGHPDDATITRAWLRQVALDQAARLDRGIALGVLPEERPADFRPIKGDDLDAAIRAADAAGEED